MIKNASKEGFTLVELSLSMVFISLLSLAIVLIIMNTISSYRKGITVSKVNSAGMEVVDDMRLAVQNSSATPIAEMCASVFEGNTARANCESDNGQKFVNIVATGNITLPDGTNKDRKNVPLFGAFCTGSYSYVWNSGYFFNDKVNVGSNSKAVVKYINNLGETIIKSDFRLLKIKDEVRAVCVQGTTASDSTKYGEATNNFDFTKSNIVMDEDPIELLAGELALYDLEVAKPAEDAAGDSLFYAVSFILGTVQGGADIKMGNSCTAPADAVEADFDYCAINKFNFAAQAAGE